MIGVGEMICLIRNSIAILMLGAGFFISSGGVAQVGDPLEMFVEEYGYLNNPHLGERLSVTFPNGENDMVRSTEFTLFEEGFYDASQGRHGTRLVALITGMGLGNTGLKLVLGDRVQRDQLMASFQEFIRMFEYFRANLELIRAKEENWMTESWQALNEGRPVGEVYFYPSLKALDSAFHWDFELNRVWMSIGSRIIVDETLVPYLLHGLQRLNRYEDAFYEYRDEVQKRNQEIDTLLGVRPS